MYASVNGVTLSRVLQFEVAAECLDFPYVRARRTSVHVLTRVIAIWISCISPRNEIASLVLRARFVWSARVSRLLNRATDNSVYVVLKQY
jgi:hypothetical protein